MIKVINIFEFVDEMRKHTTKFSRDGLEALFHYLDEIEDYNFDAIEIHCSFTEYENIKEYNNDYGTTYNSYNQITETDIIPVYGDSFIARDY